ncbi:MAG: hypothetical protein DWQ36_21805 [Acidobacteria bacterium]|nr:MAG: hypothetical protein DWQ30_00740 [Acidobacteriota bacterium]REK00826.1 MAG: hypothetical protein DWQ36_21805 [Acidobacteriota bacterium]
MAETRFTYIELLSDVLEDAAAKAGVPAERCDGTTNCFYCSVQTGGLRGRMAPAEDEATMRAQAEHREAQLRKLQDADAQEREEILECERHLREMLDRIAEIKKAKGIG